MISTEDITFNVIFVPGTVRHLHGLTHSVIRNSACRYRLVSNGCTKEEDRILQQTAAASSRVDFYRIAAETTLRHGLVLDHLHELETSGTFAFMDSDIYATGPFLPAMMSQGCDASGIFSGTPVWCPSELETVPDGFGLLKGFHNQLSDGRAVGSTYFAIYDNTALTDVIDESGVGFEVCEWDEIPGRLQKQLVSANLKYVTYDTAKLLNALLTVRGHQLCNVRSGNLKHIGGVSLDVCRHSGSRSRIQRLIRRSGSRIAGGVQRLLGRSTQQNTWHSRISVCERDHCQKIKERRHAASRHLSSVMLAFADDGPTGNRPAECWPAFCRLQHADRDLVEAVSCMQEEIIQLYRMQESSSHQQRPVAA